MHSHAQPPPFQMLAVSPDGTAAPAAALHGPSTLSVLAAYTAFGHALAARAGSFEPAPAWSRAPVSARERAGVWPEQRAQRLAGGQAQQPPTAPPAFAHARSENLWR